MSRAVGSPGTGLALGMPVAAVPAASPRRDSAARAAHPQPASAETARPQPRGLTARDARPPGTGRKP
jgi:hypothetical protein